MLKFLISWLYLTAIGSNYLHKELTLFSFSANGFVAHETIEI